MSDGVCRDCSFDWDGKTEKARIVFCKLHREAVENARKLESAISKLAVETQTVEKWMNIAFVLEGRAISAEKEVENAKLQNEELKKAIGGIHQVLGTGACKANKCEGCEYEMGEAAGLAKEMWDKYIEKRVEAPSVATTEGYCTCKEAPLICPIHHKE